MSLASPSLPSPKRNKVVAIDAPTVEITDDKNHGIMQIESMIPMIEYCKESMNQDTQLHKPKVAMVNTKGTSLFHEKKKQNKKNIQGDTYLLHTMQDMPIKKKTAIQKPITAFVFIKSREGQR